MSLPAASAVPALLTAEEVAGILRVSRSYVYEQKHRIGFVRLGRQIRFHPDALERFVAAGCQGMPERIGGISVRDL